MNSTLLPTDIVGGTFWLLSMAMIGASIFFLLERTKVASKWHTTMTLLGVVMLISAIFYHYIKTMWVDTGSAPIILQIFRLDTLSYNANRIVLYYFVSSNKSFISFILAIIDWIISNGYR